MWCGSKTLLCLVVVYIEILGCFATLKQGESGVCVVKISVRKSRTKIVSTSKMCGKKRCTAKKIEYYNTPEKRIACCNGWQYNVTSDSCGPVCTTGCLGGRCVAPEVCHCDPPNYLDPEHRNACLQPKCDPPCINAQCDINNTCSCNTDHSRFNSTHCIKCSSGYAISEEFTCSPVCDEKCVNSECTEPNKCTCLEGYQSGNISNVCEPKCENCINSTCVSPNSCSCLDGYVKLDNSTCIPSCDHCDGECVAPNVCNCRSGFTNVDGVCKPVCENCVDGVCTAPGECTCNEGFVKNADKPEICVRNCKQPTTVETSTFVFEYKSQRTVCRKPSIQCNTSEYKAQHPPRGYKCCKKKQTKTIVKPVCCVGWKWQKVDDDGKEKCLPICSPDCYNGRCVKPDKCECDAPLVLVSSNVCVSVTPVCDTPCFNGNCIANNTCKCNENYKVYNETHCEKECETGYTNDPVTLDCVPKCDESCLNGMCTSPNNCTCFDGYRLNDTSRSNCSPICKECDHGNCIAPDHCECHEGYKKENGRCVPVCDSPCQNGVCLAPNICACNAGYEKNHKNKFECLPMCYPNCVNASCVYPNMCSCHTGYKTTGNSWICEPKCDDCEHGDCVAPGKCICRHGFAKKNSKCEPICDKPCLNGFCSAPNVCTCNINYTLSVTNKFVCEPVCEQRCVNAKCEYPNTCKCLEGHEPTKDNSICKPKCTLCDHGECVAPQKCICFDGFAKINGTCEPVCNEPCVNGFCSEPNVCTCNINYTPSVTNKFVCEPVCEQRCVNAKCESPNTCKCLEGYELTKDNSICKPKCTLCDHGECVAPQKCICFDGFAKINGTCEPVCNEPCVNGFCSEPNVCTCNINYTPSVTNKFVCEPVCEQRCVNAKCESPNTCKCLEGYEPTKDNSICKPKCTLCDHGECVAPQKCICFDGFAKINGTCEPVCNEPCVNGFCSEPNVCTCNIYYTPSVTNKFVCEPVCEQRCVNAKCESPNTCKCLEGYEPTKDNSICKPKCTLCDHGECVAPQKCICFDGFAKINGTCEPVCYEPCVNGFCSEPNVCTCNINYKPSVTNKFVCEPVCEQRCVNAKCESPNTCKCLEGHEPTKDNSICKPKCTLCDHGECVAPQDCICHHGYENKNGKCEPVCDKPCSNGFCSEPNMCTCDANFKQSSTNHSSCVPICEKNCVNATCTSPNTCTCLTGYEPTIDDHICKPKCKSCVHGECIAPDMCVCYTGYNMTDGKCKITLVNCETCNSNCSSGDCSCEDGRPCVAEETTSMAGLELTGALGGAVVLLLVILIVAIMLRIYRKRKDLDKKTVDAQMDRYGSVIYTVPDTLLHKKDDDICDEDNNENDNDNDNSDNESNPAKIDTLLKPKIINMDQKF